MEQNLKLKLAKLISLRDGAKAVGSTHEADNAQNRIDDFCKKYNCTEDDAMNEYEKERALELGFEHIDTTQLEPKTEAGWTSKLYAVIARMNKCYVFNKGRDTRPTIVLVGDTFDREVVKATMESMIPLIRTMSRAAYKNYQGSDKRNTYLRSYLRGVPDGINQKYQEAKRYLAEQALRDQKALMRVNEIERVRTEVRKYVQSRWKIGVGGPGSKLSGSGRAQGISDGRSMGMGGKRLGA